MQEKETLSSPIVVRTSKRLLARIYRVQAEEIKKGFGKRRTPRSSSARLLKSCLMSGKHDSGAAPSGDDVSAAPLLKKSVLGMRPLGRKDWAALLKE